MKKILIITILSVFCASLCEAQIKADIQKQQQQKVAQQKQREQAIKVEVEKKKREQEQKAERQKRLQYEREKAKAQSATDPCVEINGVIWATRNVGQSGEFVANPENLGSSYNWKAASTACPTGWRLPTKGELESLLKASKSVISKNGVSGQLYDNSLFFPCSAASLMGGSYGHYWSNNSSVALMTSTDKIWKQEIKTNVVAQNKYRVRCVADKVDLSYYQKIEYPEVTVEKVPVKDESISNGGEVATDTDYLINDGENSTDDGVLINGVRWATRNVGTPGLFAATPESAGKMYQYGRNPCPSGWRVPTKAELKSLIKSKSAWTTRNGVNGRLFGSGSNTVFFPAVHNAGTYGNYWGSTDALFTGGSVSYLDFSERGVSTSNRVASASHCVRCVAK